MAVLTLGSLSLRWAGLSLDRPLSKIQQHNTIQRYKKDTNATDTNTIKLERISDKYNVPGQTITNTNTNITINTNAKNIFAFNFEIRNKCSKKVCLVNN